MSILSTEETVKMKTQLINLTKVLAVTGVVMSTTACASSRGGSFENIGTSIEAGVTASAQVASAAVSVPVVAISVGASAVEAVASETLDWAVNGAPEPLEISDKTLVADKNPQAAMAGEDCDCEQ